MWKTLRILATIVLIFAIVIAGLAVGVDQGAFVAQPSFARNANAIFFLAAFVTVITGIGLLQNWGLAWFIACVTAGAQWYGQFKLSGGRLQREGPARMRRAF